MKTIITLDDKKFDGQYYDTAHVETIDNNGIRIAKHVDVSILLNRLLNAKVDEKKCERIGRLPQNYFEGSIRRDDEGKISARVIIILSKSKHRVQFEKARYDMCFPSLLFFYNITSGRIDSTQVYALNAKRWNEKTILYNYPFGNVSTYGHTVCWGNNALPIVNELRELDVVTSLFLDSPCNNDHYAAEKSTKWKINNLRGVFEKLKSQETFPDKILVRSDRGCIGNLIKQLV